MNKNELNPDASPEAAYGARLRSLREARGWTQEDLATRAEYSSVHVSAVENSRKPPTLRFSRSADRAFGIEGEDTFERQFREIRHGSLLEGFPEFVDHEGRAAEIRCALKRGAITAEQAHERVTLVAERQAALVRTPPPTVFVVLDESCIRRPIGEPAVMDAQLARLAECAELPNTVVQVAPFTMGARRPFDLPVTILTMGDRSLMSYAESAQRGHLERDGKFVLPVLTAYHQLQAEACSQAESVAMVNQLRKGTP
ncbi:helix-turn-helix domain-containing protein [Streptomyces asiaticus]